MNNTNISIKSINLKHLQTNNFQPNVEAEMLLKGNSFIVKFDGDILTIIPKGPKTSMPELSKATKRYIADVLTAYVAGINSKTQFSFKIEEETCEDSSCALE